jgi:hypothetical protein
LVGALCGCGPLGAEGSADDARSKADAGAMPDGGSEPTPGVDSVPPGPSDENTGGGCTLPELPSYGELTDHDELPDPFQSIDGTRIVRKDDWTCRRAEIGAQAEQLELGPKPRKPVDVTGSFDAGALVVTAGDADESLSFTATITLPTTGSAPYPAIIALGGSSLDNADLAALGIASIQFDNDDLAAQMNAGSRGHGKFYDLYGANHGAGAMMAWAWGVSRLIDALETTPETQIDAAHLGVTGCSRNGKGALIAGAFDERIVLTIPQESGSGGSASWRVSDAMLQAGTEVQTLSEITGENCWFRSSFSQFNTAAVRLPFDHHSILAMVAPRGLLVIENTSMVWLGNVSTYTASMVAHRVWDALGVPSAMGVSQVGGHNHCQFPASQGPVVLAFAKKFLLDDDSADTNVLSTDGGYTLDDARWVDWDTPTLQ